MSATPKKRPVNKNVPKKGPSKGASTKKTTSQSSGPVAKKVVAKEKPVKQKSDKKEESKKEKKGFFSRLFNRSKNKKEKEEEKPVQEDKDNEKEVGEATTTAVSAELQVEEKPSSAVEEASMSESSFNEVEQNFTSEPAPIEDELTIEPVPDKENEAEAVHPEPDPVEEETNFEQTAIESSSTEKFEVNLPTEEVSATPEFVPEVEPEIVSDLLEESDGNHNITASSPSDESTSVIEVQKQEEETGNPNNNDNNNNEVPSNFMTKEAQNEEAANSSAAVNNTPPKEEKKKKRGMLVPFLFISLVGNLVLAWLLIREKNTVETVRIEKQVVFKEKNDVMNELLQLKEDYASLETNNVDLQKELEEKRAEIDKLIEQAAKHKNDAYIIAKLRKETESLRNIMKHYVHEIDSLNTLNQIIIAEKNKIAGDLDSQKVVTSELEKDKSALIQTVNKGSVLKAFSPTAVGVRFRGGLKEVEVNKASRVEKIKVTFTLGENSIAKKGTKTVYIHIMGPNGKEVALSESEQNSIKFGDTKGLYAEKEDVDYENKDVGVEVYCPNPSGFIPGKYLIDVICDGAIIGQTDITLK